MDINDPFPEFSDYIHFTDVHQQPFFPADSQRPPSPPSLLCLRDYPMTERAKFVRAFFVFNGMVEVVGFHPNDGHQVCVKCNDGEVYNI
jgi:hypothetical protein